MVVILIETTNLLRFFRQLQLSADKAVLRTVARLNAQATVSPELPFATEAMRSLPDLHCGGTPHGDDFGAAVHDWCVLAATTQGAPTGRQLVSQAATAVGRLLQSGAWRQRRSENDGHYRRCHIHRWLHEQAGHARELGPVPLAHYSGRSRCHRRGDLFRGLAHCAYHGTENYKAEALGRLLRGECGCYHAIRNRFGWDSSFNHSHNYRRHRWRRRRPSFLGSPVGSGEADCLGLDRNNSSVGSDRRRRILDHSYFPAASLKVGTLDQIWKQLRNRVR